MIVKKIYKIHRNNLKLIAKTESVNHIFFLKRLENQLTAKTNQMVEFKEKLILFF